VLLVSAISVCFDFDMSAKGQSRRFAPPPMTSGLPSEADTVTVGRHVSKVPRRHRSTLGAHQYPTLPSRPGVRGDFLFSQRQASVFAGSAWPMCELQHPNSKRMDDPTDIHRCEPTFWHGSQSCGSCETDAIQFFLVRQAEGEIRPHPSTEYLCVPNLAAGLSSIRRIRTWSDASTGQSAK